MVRLEVDGDRVVTVNSCSQAEYPNCSSWDTRYCAALRSCSVPLALGPSSWDKWATTPNAIWSNSLLAPSVLIREDSLRDSGGEGEEAGLGEAAAGGWVAVDDDPLMESGWGNVPSEPELPDVIGAADSESAPAGRPVSAEHAVTTASSNTVKTARSHRFVSPPVLITAWTIQRFNWVPGIFRRIIQCPLARRPQHNLIPKMPGMCSADGPAGQRVRV